MTRLPDVRRYYARPVFTPWAELIRAWVLSVPSTNEERRCA